MKLLLVEDEAAIARPLCRLLGAEGWQVLAAGTVAGALALIGQERFDAALIDLGLPDGSGFTVSRALRRAGDTAILILTARTDEASVVQCLEGGAFVNDNTLTVTVKRLREKLESDSPGAPRIATLRGIGYRWEGDVDAQP